MLAKQAGYCHLGWVPTCHSLSFRVLNWYQKERNTITLFFFCFQAPHEATEREKLVLTKRMSVFYSLSISAALDTGLAVILSVGNICRHFWCVSKRSLSIFVCVYTRQAMYVQLNIEAFVQPLLRWKPSKYCTFWVCVVALGIQHAMAHDPHCHLSAPLYISPHYPINCTVFRGGERNWT